MAFDPNAFIQASSFLNNFNNSQKHEILTVNSLQQVKDFAMNRGDSYLLLNPNADVLYIKEMDTIGKITIRSFSLIETTQELINSATPVSISKSDYEKLISRLNKLEEEHNVSTESKTKQ